MRSAVKRESLSRRPPVAGALPGAVAFGAVALAEGGGAAGGGSARRRLSRMLLTARRSASDFGAASLAPGDAALPRLADAGSARRRPPVSADATMAVAERAVPPCGRRETSSDWAWAVGEEAGAGGGALAGAPFEDGFAWEVAMCGSLAFAAGVRTSLGAGGETGVSIVSDAASCAGFVDISCATSPSRATSTLGVTLSKGASARRGAESPLLRRLPARTSFPRREVIARRVAPPTQTFEPPDSRGARECRGQVRRKCRGPGQP